MTKLKFLMTASAVFLTATMSGAASAATLLFNFVGPSGTATFQLLSNPTPDFSQTFIGSDQFSFNNVSGTYGGVAGTASSISFGNGIFSSFSLVAPNLGFTQFGSPVLFSGPPGSPTFSTGTFTLINPFFGNGTLTISEATAAVPEPATWAMMLLGFGAMGVTMRRRRRQDKGIAVA